MTFVKFCGITRKEDADAAIRLGVDALGFNFYSGSRRVISVATAKPIVDGIPKEIWRVGVFVNHSRAEIERILNELDLDTLQFHGDESEDFIALWSGHRVIRVVRLQSEFVPPGDGYVLIDSLAAGNRGGTGEEIPESFLKSISPRDFGSRILLAGGLSPTNVRSKIEEFCPYGVDVASGIEESPGVKSLALMESFMAEVRLAR